MTETGRREPPSEQDGQTEQDDEVDRLDRELAVANDLGPENRQGDPEPGLRPPDDDDSRPGGSR